MCPCLLDQKPVSVVNLGLGDGEIRHQEHFLASM